MVILDDITECRVEVDEQDESILIESYGGKIKPSDYMNLLSYLDDRWFEWTTTIKGVWFDI